MNAAGSARALVALLRLPYWLMTGGLAVLTAFAILKGNFSNIQTSVGTLDFGIVALLTFFSMAFIASAGFAINDYFDRESDAIIKPKRPIPSGALTLKQVVAVYGRAFCFRFSFVGIYKLAKFCHHSLGFASALGLLLHGETEIGVRR